MTSQGWSQGQALGSETSRHHSGRLGLGSSAKEEHAARLAAARVGTVFKDDTLGLGAKLKSKDIEGQRTGMDAFVGLLGRLNAKDEKEVREVEKEVEDVKLVRYAQGRWGGMMFVPGGTLMGGKEYGTKKAAREAAEKEAEGNRAATQAATQSSTSSDQDDRSRRKAEKRQRKEARRIRRETKAAHKAAKAARKAQSQSQPQSAATSQPTSPSDSTDDDDDSDDAEAGTTNIQIKKRKRIEEVAVSAPPSPAIPPRNGRQMLRSRNIEAKRRAFQDARGLDGIFMKAAA